MPDKTRFTDEQLRAIATTGWTETTTRLASELLEMRAQLAAIKTADPDLFDPTGGSNRGAAYETYGSPGHSLREAYLVAVGVTLGDGQ